MRRLICAFSALATSGALLSACGTTSSLVGESCKVGEVKRSGCETCTCTEDRVWDCSVDPDCESSCEPDCTEEGLCLAGDTRTTGDGHECTCSDDGEWECRPRDEPACKPDQTRSADDACNTCTCNDDGEWECTKLPCPTDPPACQEGDTREDAQGDPCTCSEDGEWECQPEPEPEPECQAGEERADGQGGFCTCNRQGAWECVPPGIGCTPGEKMGAGDGCNTCTCTAASAWNCTEESCATACTPEWEPALEITGFCDDGNAAEGDGCSSRCAVELGWSCTAVGQPCLPVCGDGTVVLGESCDDGDRDSSDGCSSTCQVEPGAICTGEPSVCQWSLCGNGVIELGESCDLGPNNGLFFGDGTGCSETCTHEPSCRDAEGRTVACQVICGNGVLEASEECDDGNPFAGDGCSSDCTLEAGFVCEAVEVGPGVCLSGADCLSVSIIFRDFEGQQVADGHPDFFHLGATVAGETTTCVPNAAGPSEGSEWCTRDDSTERALGLVESSLDADGKPVLNPDQPLVACRFTDWDMTDLLSPEDPDVTTCTVETDGSTRHRVDKSVRLIQSEETFADWYHDSNRSTKVVSTLELQRDGADLFQYSSSGGRTLRDDLHAVFLGSETTLTSGFFPVEELPGAKICNLWPYWVVGNEECVAGESHVLTSQWDPQGSFDPSETLGDGGPVPGPGSPSTEVLGMSRNFHFTSEARFLASFSGDETIAFAGNDDAWIFVNGQLALDLGGTHERLEGSIAITEALGLLPGRLYEVAVFHANRHPNESNYALSVQGLTRTRSACSPVCGDGVKTPGEECDPGAENEAGTYGGCLPDCRLGEFCGDGIVNGPETCDDGVNSTRYGHGCGPGCQPAPRCGDGIADLAFGETCDFGDEANQADSACTPRCGL